MSRLLVIDDDPIYHKMIANALAEESYQIDFASNGKQGMEMAISLSPDLIITDVMMPDITGYEVARLLRRQPQFAQTPILVLTAQTGLQDKLKSFEAGADDHLTKPFEPAELAARLAALLRRAESARTSRLSPAHEEAKFIALHSLRGGTGCSSLAVNLAVGLFSLWKTPTALLDLTMTAGQVALMLNSTLKRTWADVAHYSPAELDMDVIQSIVAKHESGLAFIAAPTYPTEAETIKGESLGAALRLLRSSYDYLVADLPHDLSDIAIQALDAADVILMLASPDMASLRAVAAGLDTYAKLNYPPEKIKLVLNWTFPRRGLAKEKIESALSVPVAITIPYTADLFVDAINYGQPFVVDKPGEPISGLLEDMAFLLSKDAHKKAKPANPTEAWQRVYKRYQERKK
ncbi:MAG: pilus assembly protein CpaE [Anaerolineaceae bacterium]|nr:MAG: pilus assembly protein CpaE [Anaerolineaceae bacterium]